MIHVGYIVIGFMMYYCINQYVKYIETIKEEKFYTLFLIGAWVIVLFVAYSMGLTLMSWIN